MVALDVSRQAPKSVVWKKCGIIVFQVRNSLRGKMVVASERPSERESARRGVEERPEREISFPKMNLVYYWTLCARPMYIVTRF